MLKNQNGQLLIESFVAISVATIGLVGILGLLSRSLSLNRLVANHYVANYLTSEGLEIMKNLVDSNIMQGLPWNSGFNHGAYEIAINPLSGDIDFNLIGSACDSIDARPLFLDSAYGYYSYFTEDGAITPFRRCVEVMPIDIDGEINELEVISETKWKDLGGSDFKITVEDHFFNWR